jgi:DNA-binding transcriptional LysR family regulator
MADLAWLRTFMAIHRTGSLSQAAKKLHLSQPAISQQLKALEAQLGWPLFSRTARGVVPTPAGEELATLVGDHVDALEAIAERMRPPSQAGSGVVHVGGPVDLLAMRVLPALAVAGDHGVRIVAHPGVVADVMASLARGELHVAVTERRDTNDDLDYELLLEYDAAIFTSKARAAALRAHKSRAARVRSIAEGPFVAFTEAMPVVRAVLETCFGVEALVPPMLIVPDLRACAEVVAAGRAIGVIARPIVEPMLERGIVEELAPDKPGPRFQLWMATRRGTSLSPRIATVRTILRDAARSWGGTQGTARKPHPA